MNDFWAKTRIIIPQSYDLKFGFGPIMSGRLSRKGPWFLTLMSFWRKVFEWDPISNSLLAKRIILFFIRRPKLYQLLILVYSRFLNYIILGSCGVFGQTQKATLFPGSPLFRS